MNRPELIDYGLTPANVEDANRIESGREFLRMRLVLVCLVSSLTLTIYWIYHKEQSISLALFLGYFLGMLYGMIGAVIVALLLEAFLASRNPLDQDLLKRHERFLADLKTFEKHRVRLLEAFWTGLSGQTFEHELAQLYMRLSYQVELTPKGRDGGIDIYLKKDNTSTIVQCKRFSNPVGVAVARELYGVLLSSKSDGAILACTGGFTKGVRDFVQGKPISLLDLKDIISLQQSIGYKLDT